jgi:hypothetical protein
MGEQAREATGAKTLTVLADRGYFSGLEVLACGKAGIVAICPKPLTSGAKADGRWGKQGFVYQPDTASYRCPAGETLTRRFSNLEHGLTLHGYATPACRSRCAVKTSCIASSERRIKRWEHEEVIDAMQARLKPLVRRHAHPTPHGRARLRHVQRLDGSKPLQVAKARKRGDRDPPPQPRLQLQARFRPQRRARADRRNAELNDRPRPRH